MFAAYLLAFANGGHWAELNQILRHLQTNVKMLRVSVPKTDELKLLVLERFSTFNSWKL